MASFTIGDFRIDVLSHARSTKNGRVEHRFVLDAFYQNLPVDLMPNGTGSYDFPGIPNRTVYSFFGEDPDGGDFRGRFFHDVMQYVCKAQLAARLNKTLSAVTEADIRRSSGGTANPHRTLMRAAFTEPVDLIGLSIEGAASRLVVGA